MTTRFTVSLILAFALSVPAMAAAPLNALTDKGDSFNAVIVEKDKKKLHIVRVTGNGVSEIKSVTVMTGRADGDKRVSGDAKTPEGVYHVTGFLSPQRLKDLYGDMSKIYGYGAFPISYPNRLDEMQGKTGGGIWLHGVENNRQDPSTKGCVAFDNDDVRAVARYIATGTPVVITRTAISGSSSQYRKMFEAVKETVIRYLKAWGENDFDSFRQAYSSSFRSSDGRSINSYIAYKRGQASSNPIRLLSADKFRVFYESENEAVAQFYQYYTAGNLSSYGRKTLYMRREGGSMKIVAEEFEATRGWTVNPSTVLVRAETPKKPEAVAMTEKPKKPETVAMAEPARKSSAVAVPDKRPEKQKDLIVAMTAMPKPPRAEKYIKPDDFAQREDLGTVPEVKEAPEPATQAEQTKTAVQTVKAEPVVQQPKAAEPMKQAEPVKPAEPVKQVVQVKPAEVAKPAAEKQTVLPAEIKKPVEVVLLDNSANSEENSMKDFVGEWAQAWASKDIDRYISHYSVGFRSGGMDLAAWKKDKGRKFGALSEIRVDIADVQVRKVSDKVYDVTFMQRYKGDTYNDTGYKTLRLDNSTGEPLVVSETYKHTSTKFPEDRAFVMAPSKETAKPAVDKLVAMTPVAEKPAPAVQTPAKPMQIIGKPAKIITEQPVEQPAQQKETVLKQTPAVTQTPAAEAPKPTQPKTVVLSEEVIEPRPAAVAKTEVKPQPEKAKPAAVAEAPKQTEKQDTIVKPEPAKAAVADASVASVYDFLIGWKSAWEAKDIDKYIALYDGSFRSGRMNLAAWKADKQRKFTALSVVHVDLDNIRVTALSDHVFEVTFTQRYTGDRYSDTGIKTLRLDNASGNVLITSELWRAK